MTIPLTAWRRASLLQNIAAVTTFGVKCFGMVAELTTFPCNLCRNPTRQIQHVAQRQTGSSGRLRAMAHFSRWAPVAGGILASLPISDALKGRKSLRRRNEMKHNTFCLFHSGSVAILHHQRSFCLFL